MPVERNRSGAVSAIAELRSHLGTGNARPVLAEVLSALEKLIDSGAETVIDLGAFPFGPGDERRLDEVLGSGELNATLDALGQSHIQETGIPGVWRIDHFDQTGETLSRFIEVTFTPEILKTQRADAEMGLTRLAARLAEIDGRSH